MSLILSLLITAIVLGILSYLFGLWDNISEYPQILVLIVLTVVYVFGTACLYITFVLWHKLLGPYF